MEIDYTPLKTAEAKYKASDRTWTPATLALYDEMLGCVPPAIYRSNGFAVGEPWTHTADDQPVYLCFRRVKAAAECRYATTTEFRCDL